MSEAYNFTSTGEGAYAFEARNLFHVVDASNKIVPVYANAEAHTARVSGKLAVARPEPNSELGKRATFRSCTATQQTLLNTAAANAQSYAASSLAYAHLYYIITFLRNALTGLLRRYLNANAAGTSRYTTWFGTYTAARHTSVKSHFQKISGNSFSGYTYDCACTDSSYAYVYPNTYVSLHTNFDITLKRLLLSFGVVYLCGGSGISCYRIN